jgi:hypothetical protein
MAAQLDPRWRRGAAEGTAACVRRRREKEKEREREREVMGRRRGEKVLRPQGVGSLAFCYGREAARGGGVPRGQPGNCPARTRTSEVSALKTNCLGRYVATLSTDRRARLIC